MKKKLKNEVCNVFFNPIKDPQVVRYYYIYPSLPNTSVVGQYFSLVYLGPLNSSDFFYWTFIFDNPKVKFVRKDNSDAISEPGPVFGPGPILGPIKVI